MFSEAEHAPDGEEGSSRIEQEEQQQSQIRWLLSIWGKSLQQILDKANRYFGQEELDDSPPVRSTPLTSEERKRLRRLRLEQQADAIIAEYRQQKMPPKRTLKEKIWDLLREKNTNGLGSRPGRSKRSRSSKTGRRPKQVPGTPNITR